MAYFNRWLWKCLFLFLINSCVLKQSDDQQGVLEEKFSQMMKWSRHKSVVKFNSNQFQQYIKTKPRNYSVIVMFTALKPERGCDFCPEANYEFTLLANSVRFSLESANSIFFVSLDFDDGNEVFRSLRLKSAPSFIHFPKNGKRKVSDTFDVARQGFAAETLARWLTERTDIKIRIFRPPNYSGTFLAGIFFLFAGIFTYYQRVSLEFMCNKTLWSLLSVFAVLLMTSGQAWNHIRGAGYYHKNPRNGMITYIARGSHHQYIAETYIVLAVNAAVVLGFVVLNEGGNSEGNVKRRKALSVLGLIILMIFLSSLVYIFRLKYPSYPYGLLFR